MVCVIRAADVSDSGGGMVVTRRGTETLHFAAGERGDEEGFVPLITKVEVELR